MKEIETSKGRFIVMEVSDWGLTKKQLYELEFPIIEKIGFIHNITEEEAIKIVDNSVMNALFYNNYINEGYNGRTWLHSATESLHSLLESQGIEITQNTYIFKV